MMAVRRFAPASRRARDPRGAGQRDLRQRGHRLEIAIKRTLGKLSAPPDLVSLIVEEGFRELPISFADGERAGQLPLLHRDPFDRMLIAQSQAHDLTILTRDDDIPRYDVRTYWA